MGRGTMPRLSLHRLFQGIACTATATLSTFAWAASPQTPRVPQRIVSLNLCSDQLVLALVDRAQIAGLTRNAGNPEMSAAAAQTRGLPILRQSAEEILDIDPDLIIGMPARSNAMIDQLTRGHARILDLQSAESYNAIIAQIRTVAAAVGHPRRGEALIARMNQDLAALPRSPGNKIAAYYQRRGFMTGAGTLVDDLMTRVGLRNLATALAKPALSQLPLEDLIAAHPNYLIVETATDRITDQGTEMLHHPVLADIPRLKLPQAWTICGGPAYVLAARSLSQQIAVADRQNLGAR
jgi:iron complex transport system substrate-binding protein